MIKGFKAIREHQEKMDQNKSGGGGKFLRTITWSDDRDKEGTEYSKTLRFISDEPIECKLYSFVPCIDGKKRMFIEPQSVGVEGTDWVKESGAQTIDFGTKQPVPAKWRNVVIGIAVLREEYRDENGRIAFRDKVEKYSYEKDGKTIEGENLIYGVVIQGYRNFWSSVEGYHDRFGTIMDRDYTVQRKGNGVDTNYVFIPEEKIEGLITAEQVANAYEPPISLEEFVKELADPERAKNFLVGEGNVAPKQAEPVQSAPASASDDDVSDKFNDFRAQLTAHIKQD